MPDTKIEGLRNCQGTVDGISRELTLVIDLNKNEGPSSTGKTWVVASTHGWFNFEQGGKQYCLSMNLMERMEKK